MSFLHKNCNLRRVHKMKEVLQDTAWSAVRLPDRTSSPKVLNVCLYSQNKGQHLLVTKVKLCRRKRFVLFKYY